MTETKPCPCGTRGHEAPEIAPPRIHYVRFITADGRDIRRYVSCPYYIKDPEASIFGLEARFAFLKFHGLLRYATATPVTAPRHRKACLDGRGTPGHRCDCFHRWTEIPELAAA
jgi:hypothetical protein